jgi:hypothetical protein
MNKYIFKIKFMPSCHYPGLPPVFTILMKDTGHLQSPKQSETKSEFYTAHLPYSHLSTFYIPSFIQFH